MYCAVPNHEETVFFRHLLLQLDCARAYCAPPAPSTFYPAHMRRGKVTAVLSLSSLSLSTHKTARSRHLGILASDQRHEGLTNSEKVTKSGSKRMIRATNATNRTLLGHAYIDHTSVCLYSSTAHAPVFCR